MRDPLTPSPEPAWLRRLLPHTGAWRIVALLLAAGAVLYGWIRVSKPHGDFPLHWEFGRRFLAGEYLYAGGMHVPYLPFWAMASAPWSLLPEPAAQMVAYPFGVGAAALLVLLLHRLSQREMPLGRDRLFWVTTLALLFGSRFLLRELPECGPNLLLVTLAWSAVYLWSRGRDLPAGLLLGLGIALKSTPGLFLLYFAWKRQWRVAAAAGVTALLLSVAPALRMGPAYGEHLRAWAGNVYGAVSDGDPMTGVIGPEKVQNLALRPVLARFLMRLPVGHPARLDHPAYVEFQDLPPRLVDRGVSLVLLALVLLATWRFRKPPAGRGDPAVPWECAAVSVLMLLVSPITWGQHCVAALPALYLLARRAVSGGKLPRAFLPCAAVWLVSVLALSYEVVGRANSELLHSYGLLTWNLVGLLALTMSAAASVSGESGQSVTTPAAPASRRETPEALRRILRLWT